jgi:hypothetical protein
MWIALAVALAGGASQLTSIVASRISSWRDERLLGLQKFVGGSQIKHKASVNAIEETALDRDKNGRVDEWTVISNRSMCPFRYVVTDLNDDSVPDTVMLEFSVETLSVQYRWNVEPSSGKIGSTQLRVKREDGRILTYTDENADGVIESFEEALDNGSTKTIFDNTALMEAGEQ